MRVEIKDNEINALKWLLTKGIEQTNSNRKFEIFQRLSDDLHQNEDKMSEQEIIQEFLQELERAENKHPDWPEDIIHQVAIMVEEAGESLQAALECVYEDEPEEDIYKEVIETAAMCIRILKNR